MPGGRVYMPVLKWRMGEYQALHSLPDATKESIRPLAEIAPRPWDYENDVYSKSLDEHLAKVPDQVRDNWGVERPIALDTGLLDADDRMGDGLHPLRHLAHELASRGVIVVPVTGLDRDDASVATAAHVASECGAGACLRVGRTSLLDPYAMDRLMTLTSGLGLGASDVDLVIDLGPLETNQIDLYRVLLVGIVASLPDLNAWRSLTLASGAFPRNMSDLGPGTHPIPRHDWLLWRQLVNSGRLSRTPDFGDYAIAHPELGDIDPRTMRMSANLRYTSGDEWIIFRGRDVRREGYEQMRTLCQQLIDHPCYRGMNHCGGDHSIFEIAQNSRRTGNATTWRRIGTAHHLTCVVEQLASPLAT